MKKHDENKDLRLISKKSKVNFADKTISIPKTATIGIKTWGRIDFLVNHCGWILLYNNSIVISKPEINNDIKENKKKKELRKQTKKLNRDKNEKATNKKRK